MVPLPNPVVTRLIPARAGNMGGCQTRCHQSTAHPRSRGEHSVPSFSSRARFGSSPLARGTYIVRARVLLGVRLIPARAGNIMYARYCLVGVAAHPRSRGEHEHCLTGRCATAGSSPLARGTYRDSDRLGNRNRLIPARAGNIAHPSPPRPRASAHPRSRGEHGLARLEAHFGHGSSPLARGTWR